MLINSRNFIVSPNNSSKITIAHLNKSCKTKRRLSIIATKSIQAKVGFAHVTRPNSPLNYAVQKKSEFQKSVVNILALDILAQYSKLKDFLQNTDAWTANSGLRKIGNTVYSIKPEPLSHGFPSLSLDLLSGSSSSTFRLLRLIWGRRQDGQEVLHVLACPNASLDLPIFALDLLVANGVFQGIVVDTPTLSGQPWAAFDKICKQLEQQYLSSFLSSSASFNASSHCYPSSNAVQVKAGALLSGQEVAASIKFVSALLTAYLSACQEAATVAASAAAAQSQPMPGGATASAAAISRQEKLQERYGMVREKERWNRK
uniref:Uncharacterized protein n=1 Tax=Polytomella parva TaxID=51329 RepID=A0A7S0USR7_9CHLO